MLGDTDWGLGLRVALGDSDLVVKDSLAVGVFVGDSGERDAEQLTVYVPVDVLLGVATPVLLPLVLQVEVGDGVHVVVCVAELVALPLSDAPVTLGV